MRKWKCAAGIVGGAVVGVFTGAGAGSVFPVIGTIGCGIMGGITGAMAAGAGAC